MESLIQKSEAEFSLTHTHTSLWQKLSREFIGSATTLQLCCLYKYACVLMVFSTNDLKQTCATITNNQCSLFQYSLHEPLSFVFKSLRPHQGEQVSDPPASKTAPVPRVCSQRPTPQPMPPYHLPCFRALAPTSADFWTSTDQMQVTPVKRTETHCCTKGQANFQNASS